MLMAGIQDEGVRSLALPVRICTVAIRKISRKIFSVVIATMVCAGMLWALASCRNSPTATDKLSAAEAASAEIKSLLSDGPGESAEKYFKETSQVLVEAATGKYNSKFYDLGKL